MQDLTAALDRILRDYRAAIVLLAEEPEEGSPETTVAWLLHERVQENLQELAEALEKSPRLQAFLLDQLEKDSTWHDGDKLAFKDLLEDFPSSPRVEHDQQVLLGIQNRYDAEIKKLLGYLPTRGMVDKREAWDSYLASLRKTLSKDAPMAEFKSELEALSKGTRAGKAMPWKDDREQIIGRQFPEKTLLLTFDDGPSKKHTPAILEVLKTYGIKAVFFEVGRNLRKTQALAQQQIQAGHTLANHTFTHAFLPKLNHSKLEEQLTDTNQALLPATKASPGLFRPPYGARSDDVLTSAEGLGMKTVLWNIDSKDWADPVPASIARRVLGQVEKEKRGIMLFHDIHARTAKALPLVLDELVKQGYTFLAWDGKAFVTTRGGSGEAAIAAGTTLAQAPLYRESWAVVIGVNAYKNWPKLAYAVNDATAVRDLLVRKFGFAADHIKTLLDGEATRENILAALGDDLSDSKKVAREDRVFVFFAGHGATRKLPNGKSQGYIIPVEADAKNFQSQAISMTNFQDIADGIAAKHIFFVMDACYSGLALTRGGSRSASGDRQQYWKEITRRLTRQVMTAGGADEQVADTGPNGHSIFTWTLLQGLEGKADLDADGAITGTELFSYMAPSVSSLSRQTPAFGSMPGSEGGEFIFVSKGEDEFLSEESRQLDTQAIELNATLEKIRKQVEEKRAKVEKLKGELAVATAALENPRSSNAMRGSPDGGAPVATPTLATSSSAVSATNNTQSRRETERAMGLYREKRYEEAAQAFESALRFNPNNVLAANNLGFTYVKMERLLEAIAWYEKTLVLDPLRALAYANLGDAYAKVGRVEDAKRAYTRFLELRPDHKIAANVRERLSKLGQ
jgi:peptidoglycan/xylan/chitin deacetylase (PgdA/CDA1 family)/uncharacterized caspase-like protein